MQLRVSAQPEQNQACPYFITGRGGAHKASPLSKHLLATDTSVVEEGELFSSVANGEADLASRSDPTSVPGQESLTHLMQSASEGGRGTECKCLKFIVYMYKTVK